MTIPKPTDRDFAALLAPLLDHPVQRVDIAEHQERLYSNTWILRAHTQKTAVDVVAKQWSDAGAFKRQIKALEFARDAYAGRPDVCIPYLGVSEPHQLLLMQRVPDPNIERLCILPFPRLADRGNALRWKASLEQACIRVGQWLREWHTTTADVGPVKPALESYLERRPEFVALLGKDDQRRLWTLVESLQPEATCVVHGDFAPINILWSPSRLTVVDFGIAECERTTPWWDYVSMEIGLSSALRFSMRSPGMWFPSIARMACSAFSQGYGTGTGSSRTRLACLAVRYLTLYGSDIRNGRRYRKRAAWHRLQLEKVMAAV
ncbi:MAG TPA: phosphotransferase [Gammaproteobacteria bacterium]|nr:phosphotransferase [Gammaproteobacteria bacterium]